MQRKRNIRSIRYCQVLYAASHKTKVSELNGIGKKMPFTMVAFSLASRSIIGIPPLGGFISEPKCLGSIKMIEPTSNQCPFFTFFSHDSGIRTKEAQGTDSRKINWLSGECNQLLACGHNRHLGNGIFTGIPDNIYC